MGRDWIIPASAIVALQYCFALLLGARIGFHYSIPLGAYLMIALVLMSAVLLAVLVYRLAVFAIVGEPSPARKILAETRDHQARLLEFCGGVALVGLQIAVLTWLKTMLPIASPYWADNALATADRALFGTDPWRISHAALGWASSLIDRAYVAWAPIKFATLLCLLCMSASPAKSRALLAYFLIMTFVAIGQYSLSSAGPVFNPDFADLPVTPWVETARAYLLADYLRGGGDIGTGISAMPSLHVAIALWLALVTRSFVPRLQFGGWLYFAMVAVGSVHLGWHYAADSFAAIAIGSAAWSFAAKIQVLFHTRQKGHRPAKPAKVTP